LEKFFGTDDIAFTFVSDEFNGTTTNGDGTLRPRVEREYASLSAAAIENSESRLYLGVHWRKDCDDGRSAGNAIGEYVYSHSINLADGVAIKKKSPRSRDSKLV
jgi:hypothetical protein